MKHDKTPWNPSKTATARVRNPLPAPTKCPFCDQCTVKIVHHDYVYGRVYGEWPWVYMCKACWAYVGIHPFTNIPLGTLADGALRKARKNCKDPFEQIYLSKKMTRDEAYMGLAEHFGIPKEECHFGWFNIEQCEMARAWSVEVLKGVAA